MESETDQYSLAQIEQLGYAEEGFISLMQALDTVHSGQDELSKQDAIKNEGNDSILHTVGELSSSHPSLNARPRPLPTEQIIGARLRK